jgi:hypothetical protein
MLSSVHLFFPFKKWPLLEKRNNGAGANAVVVFLIGVMARFRTLISDRVTLVTAR